MPLDVSQNMSPRQFFIQTLGGAANQDYHRTYLFKVLLPDVPNKNNNEAMLAGQTVYFIASTTAPVENTGTIPVDWMNSQIKIAGRTTYNEWSVVVRDDVSGKGYKYFKEWKKIVFNYDTGVSAIPLDYKLNIDLILLKHDGSESRGYKIYNAYPNVIGEQNFSYSDENIVTFPITIQHDGFLPIDKYS